MLRTVKRDTTGTEEVQATTTPNSRIRPHHVDPRTKLLVGAVIGSVVGLVLVLAAILLWRQYRRTARRRENDASRAEQATGRPSSGEQLARYRATRSSLTHTRDSILRTTPVGPLRSGSEDRSLQR